MNGDPCSAPGSAWVFPLPAGPAAVTARSAAAASGWAADSDSDPAPEPQSGPAAPAACCSAARYRPARAAARVRAAKKVIQCRRPRGLVSSRFPFSSLSSKFVSLIRVVVSRGVHCSLFASRFSSNLALRLHGLARNIRRCFRCIVPNALNLREIIQCGLPASSQAFLV